MTEMKKMEAEKTAMAMKEKEAMAMKEKEAAMASGTDAMMKKDGEVMDKEAMMKKEEAMKGDVMMKKSAGLYTAYSPDKLALAKTSKVVIFFHAAWCPTCRALDAEITSKGVKEGFTILKVDYDNSKELKAKYGVTTQHTLVQVDASGSNLSKWSGGDLSMIYSKAK